MRSTKVVHLGQVRDLLAEWEKVRQALLSGGIVGFHTALRGPGGGETLFVGGAYKDDPKAAMRVILKASAARVMAEDEPPQLKKKRR